MDLLPGKICHLDIKLVPSLSWKDVLHFIVFCNWNLNNLMVLNRCQSTLGLVNGDGHFQLFFDVYITYFTDVLLNFHKVVRGK